jgi:cbb3-type cytochrome oxidase subunit 3
VTTLFILWMLVSMAIFITVIAWALWPKNAKRFERYAAIPLRDDRDEA